MTHLEHEKEAGFTIVIPTYDRPEGLARCLDALERVDYPRDRFEVIVVDDGGSTDLDAICADPSRGIEVRLHRQENAGPASARNAGAAAAAFDTLVFIDDDCAPAPEYLRAFADELAKAPESGLGGRTIGALEDDIYSMTSQLLVSYLFEYYNTDPEDARFFTSNNLALPKHLFDEIGGFDTRFPIAAAEDRDLCDRWVSRGFVLRFADEALTHHYHHMTLRRFWRQHHNYGRGAAAYHRGRRERNEGPVKLEPLRFYWGLLTYPYREGQARAFRMSMLMVVSQVANAWGFFKALILDRSPGDRPEIVQE